ncbi:flavin reductase family protein [Conexibacter sp. JD483]|uniref:flavin reductase family protein n=1 Tax=unclassified Conexibacter TaxID=2627773 RepID=UPI00271D466A|nr:MULTISPECIES: flavin reductase family protein [unclassified Conexibacter]MDO8186524.1 flavin reductase family protein [Conexibacter sp. CPCC 205706]MDO8200093.1 flavin reductase family protein [Conexibacter sp. CPCC 205762]MDR9372191.1 flavin reductase family protein [Conexibacter sp. JD483]
MGHFATGVTIVTAAAAGGEPCGGTANAVSSLSLEPALALVCLREGSLTLATLLRARAFAFNVLGRDQEQLALRFAAPGLRPAERFAGIGWRAGESGAPLLDGVVATVECSLHDVADGGDHRVVIGRVLAVEHPQRHAPPLVFHRGRFTGIEAAG